MQAMHHGSMPKYEADASPKMFLESDASFRYDHANRGIVMIKRRILELLLDRVHVPKRGRNGSGESRHMLRVSLIWPRMAIAHKTAVNAVSFRDGVYRPSAASWTQRALFKEAVEGPFGIRVEVSEAMSDKQWAEAVARFGSAVWTLAGGQFGDLAAGSLAALLWQAPFDALSRTTTAAARSDPPIVAAGTLDVRCDDWPALEEERLTLTMTAPDDVIRIQRRRVGGSLQTRRSTLIKRDEANGETELIARVYR